MQEDQALVQLRTQYLLAHSHYYCGKLERYQFNAIIIEVIIGLMERFDDYEPYITLFREEAEKKLSLSKKLDYLTKK